MIFKMTDIIDQIDDDRFLKKTAEFYGINYNLIKLSDILESKCLNIDELEKLANFHYLSVRKLLMKLQHFFPDVFTIKYLRKMRKMKELLRQENFQ